MTQGPDQIHAALKAAIEVETHGYLWTPSDGIDFVPALASTVFGDGRALLRIAMIDHRPRYHVVRIDSTWAVGDDPSAPARPDLWDFIDDIYEALEEEFGPLRDEESDTDRPWPAFDSEGGTSWRRMRWPELSGVSFTPHPYAPHFEIVAGTIT